MRHRLTCLAVLVSGLFVAGSIMGGTAHADPVAPVPEPTFAIECPPICDVPEPEPEIELNCPPICIDDLPSDLVLDDPCTPDLCGPFPPDGDDGEDEPDGDEPTEELTPTDPGEGGGGTAGGATGGTASDTPGKSSATGLSDDTEPVQMDSGVIAPVNDGIQQPADSDTSNAVLLAVLATSLGLAAGGGLIYAVLRRR